MAVNEREPATASGTVSQFPVSLASDTRGSPLSRRSADQFAPIFLHSSFRTGSTWLWSKIRSAPTTFAYYEIFHEGLSTMTPGTVAKIDVSHWDARHPETAAYFLEYSQLLSVDGGIAGFDKWNPLEGFIPQNGADGELTSLEKAYVERLVATARAKQRIPVLSCTRSLGRARALRKCAGGKTIVLYRNLFHQWASYCWQKENGNDYFMDTIGASFAASQHDPFLRSVADWYGLAQTPPSEEDLFAIFLLLHLYLYSIAYDAADLVVDLPEIVANGLARERVEGEISNMISFKINLSDARENCDFTALAPKSPVRMWSAIDQFAKLIPTDCLSNEAVAFVHDAKEAAYTEWDRFEFYNRRTRAVLVNKIDALMERRAAEQVEAELLAGSLETSRKANAETEAEALVSARRADEAEGRIAELRTQIDGLQAQLSARRDAAVERDAIAHHLADAQAETRGLRSFLQTSTVERDAAFARADALQAELASALSRRDELDRILKDRETKLYSKALRLLRRR